ncbi:MAG: hypothetical protein U9N59_06485 [Campylobacterota bacterium]|nr:hypothetical protein [Campylobacterota bacterium]
MSDYDYGRENGLWGDDGIPYGIDSYESQRYARKYNYKSKSNAKAYNRSEKRALANGFKEVEDEDTYNGRFFVKNYLLWIHNISALKRNLGVSSNHELFRAGYDVEAYYAS